MKKLFVTLLFVTSTLLLSAQSSDSTRLIKYEYAYIYTHIYKQFNVKVHYENGQDTIFSQLNRNNLINGKDGLIEFFDILTNAFHYIENKGYEQIGSNRTFYKYGEEEVPYFIFRRVKVTK